MTGDPQTGGLGQVELSLMDPQPSREQILAVVGHARQEGIGAVWVPSTSFPLRGTGGEGEPSLCTVAGYPTGQHHVLVKASEAHMAVTHGADEVTVVLDPSHVFGGLDGTGDPNALISEIVTLREAVPYPAVLRVAVGTVRGPGQTQTGERVPAAVLQTVARAAVTAGADVVVGPSDDTVGESSTASGVEETVRILAEATEGSPVKVMSGRVLSFDEPDALAAVEQLTAAGAHRVVLDAGSLTSD
ncbi:MAG TPA: hypothetical protein H9870_03700 [Candidatus Corynebacterium avicola]|uniref:Deoxyribose-phosphate aldolase n=1 Tax=Candidatus Corynebacterium avicola TaxID=2838527 RepID=A0A9D1RMD9_9CORY|nr:hypothetical protein [Candidatus Corynebacterium avicola]